MIAIDWPTLWLKFWAWIDAHFSSTVVELIGGTVLIVANVVMVYVLPHWLAAGLNATLWSLFWEIFVDKNPVGKVGDVAWRELVIAAVTVVLYLFR